MDTEDPTLEKDPGVLRGQAGQVFEAANRGEVYERIAPTLFRREYWSPGSGSSTETYRSVGWITMRFLRWQEKLLLAVTALMLLFCVAGMVYAVGDTIAVETRVVDTHAVAVTEIPEHAAIAYHTVDFGETQVVVPRARSIAGYWKIEVDSRELGRRTIYVDKKIAVGAPVQVEYVIGRWSGEVSIRGPVPHPEWPE
jgi:hypothetical protein